jgi:hypothetical protein
MRLATSNVLSKIFHIVTTSNLVSHSSNRFRIFNNIFKGNLKAAIRYRFTIHTGKVFWFPSECRELHVVSGIAWITVAGEDIILPSERTALIALNQDVIISPLGDVPLILEVL